MTTILRAFGLLAISAAAASAQMAVSISGRVIDCQDGAVIAGIMIQLDSSQAHITGRDGSFEFQQVSTGPHVLSVRGIGYAPHDTSLVVRSDTAVEIRLGRIPIQPDTPGVEDRGVRLPGEIRDQALDIGVADGGGCALPDPDAVTDPIGRLRFDGVPASVLNSIRVRELGYLSLTTTFHARTGTDPAYRSRSGSGRPGERLPDYSPAR